LIIGGVTYSNEFPFIQSVELYNWRTGKQCQLPDFPMMICCGTAAVMGGTPAYCGGGGGGIYGGLEARTQFGCYKFEKNSNTWTMVL
jgi:hypothetical protein